MQDQSEEQERQANKERVERLRQSKFKQQTLPAWRPVPTFLSTLVTFLVFGVVFLALGIVLYIMSDQITEASIRYDNLDTISTTSNQIVATLTLTEKMEAPIFVYYELENFYQNHRRYVKSRSYKQLRGESMTIDDIQSDCDPIVTYKDLGLQPININGDWDDDIAEATPANPCGLVAKSFFNDTYALSGAADGIQSKIVDIDESNIAWESDVEYKFKNLADDSDGLNYTYYQWIDVTDEHFIVWMRTAGLPTFRKLWGRIDEDLSPGDYQLTIDDNYAVDSFDGKKSFVLSTTNIFGGKNTFLAGCYIVVGALCIIFAIIFSIAFFRKQNLSQEGQ